MHLRVGAKIVRPLQKIRIACKVCKPELRNNPESMEIRLTAGPISRINNVAGFQAASELVLS
ncbi:hypothetical protein BLAT2472_100044 [Burkholderia latens]